MRAQSDSITLNMCNCNFQSYLFPCALQNAQNLRNESISLHLIFILMSSTLMKIVVFLFAFYFNELHRQRTHLYSTSSFDWWFS